MINYALGFDTGNQTSSLSGELDSLAEKPEIATKSLNHLIKVINALPRTPRIFPLINA